MSVQSLDIISINLWQILISLANLLIMFLIVKKFLFKPVMNIMNARQEQVDKIFLAAATAANYGSELDGAAKHFPP